MRAWKATVDVSDVFHNDDLSMSEKAQAIASRLGRIGDRLDPDDTELDELLEELCDAGHEERESWFNSVWDGVYDWADEHRVWVKTR